ncbi:GNAT family N-acetyltransferase [Sphingosinicellaceae bacterium]|nr:GNAT family N-acetyltransferase [Sphingosinicellaceae bacterium]
MTTGLHAPLSDGDLELVPLTKAHRDGLRTACAADPEIWAMFPYSMLGDAFDPAFDHMLETPGRLAFAVLQGGEVLGCTSYMHDADNAAVEIGGTYIHPKLRSTGANRRMKALLIDRAFGFGIGRIEFRVDTRNARSMAAVAGLGAHLDGVLRRNRVTWTGFVRDTAVYSLLPGESR